MNYITVNGRQVQLQEVEIPTQDGSVSALRGSFSAKLISISEEPVKNSNGTNFKVATGEYVNADAVVERASFQVYEGNYEKGMTIGEKYSCQITIQEGRELPGLTMSHLVAGGGRATLASFGVSTSSVTANEPVSSDELA